MSFIQANSLRFANRSQLQIALHSNITQIRTATKKVSGSKTNKNDSAGRRLGPKVHEGHFVKTGQIIMRQRGTKIHPGENVDIGKDHTIFATEPGYVRFYLDPFHPLRKYVGVALKHELGLPTPHFEPRLRRFGYEQILDEGDAKREENHMSRPEYLQQPELEQAKQLREQQNAELLAKYNTSLGDFIELNENDSKLACNRLLNIAQLVNAGQTIQDANVQATYNYIYQLKLSMKRGEIANEDAVQSLKQHYLDFAATFDAKLSLDADLNICKYISPEERATKQSQTLATLQEKYTNKLISKEDKAAILDLIKTPGVYTKAEQESLIEKFLPKVIPETVPGATVEVPNPNKPPKGVTVQRVFDAASKRVQVVGIPKDAYLA